MSNQMPSMLTGLPHKAIVGDDLTREKMCLQEVSAVLARYDCILIPKIIIRGAQIEAQSEIRAKPRGVPANGN